jgi:hypothetical protein
MFQVGVFTLFNSGLVTTQDISIARVQELENLPVEFGKLQSLVELDLSSCSVLGCLVKVDLSECSELQCLPDSIVDLSKLKTFRLWGCHKLENLLVEFGKLESLVKLDLSKCSKLGHLLDSIVDLAQFKTF